MGAPLVLFLIRFRRLRSEYLLRHTRPMQDFLLVPADLAPGDKASATFDLSRLGVHRIASARDPLFVEAYYALWSYFSGANEIESAEVLSRRLALNEQALWSSPAMCYDLVLFRAGGSVAAVCDHTAVADEFGVVVHVSHILIDPAWRRTGLGGWIRALPIQTARRCLAEAGLPAELPITLVAEVEYPYGSDERAARLRSFERAGFLKIDPAMIDYHQPDFRPMEVIDATGGPLPLPFQLLIRRVGRENATHVTGAEARWFVEQLYRVYGRDFREWDMAVVYRQLESYPPADAQIRLIAPTL